MSDKTPGLTAHTTDEPWEALERIAKCCEAQEAAGVDPMTAEYCDVEEHKIARAALAGKPGTGPTGPDALKGDREWVSHNAPADAWGNDGMWEYAARIRARARAEGKAEGLEAAARWHEERAARVRREVERLELSAEDRQYVNKRAAADDADATAIRSLIPAAPGEITK